MKLDIKIYCNDCGATLGIMKEKLDVAPFKIFVEACSNCTDDAQDVGRAESYQLGFEEGKEEGFEEGKREN